MLLIACPWCGKRPENEFHYGGEAHIARPLDPASQDDAAWAELQKVSPIAVTDAVANAAVRQRNCYFTSSDAAFHDRYEASAEWDRVRAGAVAAEGGWRVYSGGPGLFVDLLVGRMTGSRRFGGK